MDEIIEKRFVSDYAAPAEVARVGLECRCGGKPDCKCSNQQRKIVGYAAIFDSRSHDLGGFREIVSPGAFAGVLKRSMDGDQGHDVVALFDHTIAPGGILGRLSSGTLKLFEDSRGLRYEIDPPKSADWLVEAIQRRDITGSSFSFASDKRSEKWDPGKGGDLPLRRINEIKRLADVGPVVNPAYPGTSGAGLIVSPRCLREARRLAGGAPAGGSVAVEARALLAIRWIRERRK